jgi:sulfur transfer complex TusBCD TusB component (DsrH family)
MAEPYRCLQCERREQECTCERYCALCQSEDGVRLCEDGNYYCLPCRESMDYQAQY